MSGPRRIAAPALATACLFMLLLAFAGSLSSGESAADTPRPSIGGVYELCIGVDDLVAQAAYWQQFGYSLGSWGRLDASRAKALYGVDSPLRSLRLEHQDADHGLIRLMKWDRPLGEGLGLSPMKVLGGRWGAMLTGDVYRVLNHAEIAREQGLPVYFVPPQRQVIYEVGGRTRPFLDPVVCAREMCLLQPMARQILFQRYNYEIPLYGKINANAHFPTSQVTHAGLVLQGSREPMRFYEEALGLLRAREGGVETVDEPAARNIFELQPGESYTSTDFDDPRSVPSDLSRVRSGRLKVILFSEESSVPDLRRRSRPGYLGLTLYTYRVTGLERFRERVSGHGARDVTPVVNNEFGEPSIAFTSPDGYAWALVGRGP